jgi:hypothetical protein
MKILVDDGSVVFSEGTIGSHMGRQAFLRSRIGKSSKAVVVNAPWITYNFSPETGIACNAIFRNELLIRLSIMIRLPSDDTSKWSDADEHKRQVLHDEWLQAELGKPPYCYVWGQIESGLDRRDGFSDIIVAYAD